MTPDNDEVKYKNLLRENEEATDIPEFDEILNLPVRQKKYSNKLTKVGSVMILCLTFVIGIYLYQNKKHEAGVSKNETALFQDKKPLVWEWTSPTQQLLSASLTFTSFNMPTDFLSPKRNSLQANNNKKRN